MQNTMKQTTPTATSMAVAMANDLAVATIAAGGYPHAVPSAERLALFARYRQSASGYTSWIAQQAGVGYLETRAY